MPDLSHLWQRFVLASTLVFGLALGVAATMFGYSNTAPVNVGFSVIHLKGIPLWTVAVVPLVLVLAVGTLYHWWNSLHHFTEHMRHRKRVRELEAEVASLRSRLDNVLEMPDQTTSKPAVEAAALEEPEPVELELAPALSEPKMAANGDDKSLPTKDETEVVAAAASDGGAETTTRAETQPGA